MKIVRKFGFAGFALGLVLLAGFPARATTPAAPTGPAGTNPVINPSILGDLSAFFNSLNSVFNLTSLSNTTAVRPEGVLFTLLASSSTSSTTVEQTLGSYTLPATTFDANGRRVRITASFIASTNANNKTFKINFGAAPTTFATAALTLNNQAITLQMDVLRTAAGTHIINGRVLAGGGSGVFTAPTVQTDSSLDSAAINVWASATDGTASAGDVALTDLVIEYQN